MIRLRGANVIIKILPKKELPMGLVAVNVGKEWNKDQHEAEVICVGPDVLEVEPGDRIIITGAAGRWIDPGVVDSNDRDSTYRFLTEDEILGVLVAEEVPA